MSYLFNLSAESADVKLHSQTSSLSPLCVQSASRSLSICLPSLCVPRSHQQRDETPHQQSAESQPPAEGRRAEIQAEAEGDADGDQQGRPAACRPLTGRNRRGVMGECFHTLSSLNACSSTGERRRSVVERLTADGEVEGFNTPPSHTHTQLLHCELRTNSFC